MTNDAEFQVKFGPMTGVRGPARCAHVLDLPERVSAGGAFARAARVECQRPAGHPADHRGPGNPHDIPGAVQWSTGDPGDWAPDGYDAMIAADTTGLP